MGFIPDDWLQSLDYSTLEKVSGSYISEDFKQREDDIVWRVKVGGAWVITNASSWSFGCYSVPLFEKEGLGEIF